ncbi:Coiled-coil domain-containing protein 138 [Acropora cervicornis]|uniref:Coiled-coil domain-containing protein 138 n=1 Tax=Acropora cervicornis TaxID=6130 RepID=A0AAD9Q255_ACRCE|nr:Coiled-coil domain-containing protein 138 [Acropora cervicornis]
MDGPVPNSKKEKPYPSPPEENFLTPPHTSRDGPHEMSSSERRQYNKALRAMYEIVRLGSKRLAKPSAADDDKSNDDDDEDDDDVIPETVTETSDNEENDGIHRQRQWRTKSYENQVQNHMEAENVKKIHKELMRISAMLQKESEALNRREVQLREREKALRDAEKLSHTTDIIIDRRYESKLVELEEVISKKTRELKRMKDSFDTIKTANDSLKKQITDLQQQNKKLETQALNVQHRLANLQRKNEFLQRGTKRDDKQIELQRNSNKLSSQGKEEAVTKSVSFSQSKVNLSGLFEVLSILLEWTSDTNLQKMPTFQDSPQGSLQEQNLDFPSALVHEKCSKILPGMSDILSYLPNINPRVQQPCLQFTYWCIVFMEQTVQGSQRSALASTLRHIGEELFKPQVTKVAEEGSIPKSDRHKTDIYFHSPNIAVRILSSFIILKTLSRVDFLAQVFDVLKTDLKDDVGLLSSAIDVLLLMSVDSPFTSSFLESCSNEPWFRTTVNLLQRKGLDSKILEKLSIVLQRLSKVKSNRRYFEAFQIAPIVQEMLRTCDPQNAFLALNLRSIIFNLGQGK